MKKVVCSLYLSLTALGLLNSCNKSSSGDVDFIPVQSSEGSSWHFINPDGERVGHQEWEYEPTVTIGGLFTVKTSDGYGVFRWNGDVAEAIDSLQGLVSVGVYNEGLLPVTPAMQRIRVVDGKGDLKFVLEPIEGREVTMCSGIFREGLMTVSTVDGKCGVVNDKGEVVIKPIFSEISDFNEGYALAAIYDPDNYEAGPTYYVIDKDAHAVKVEGRFGYPDGECFELPSFEHGQVTVVGPYNENGDVEWLDIDTQGKVSTQKSPGGIDWLDNGDKITSDYSDSSRAYTWTTPDGKVVMRVSGSNLYVYALGRYVVVQKDSSTLVYGEDGQLLSKFPGEYYGNWVGGKFGLILRTYDSTGQRVILLNSEGKEIEGGSFYGAGTSKSIDLSDDEIDCGGYSVASAYVDIVAATTKIVSMIDGTIPGKSNYYLGEAVKSILDGENTAFLSGRSFSIPTPEGDNYLATGPGFTISGTINSSADVVLPTYQTYFEVDYYDYWGNAWGSNRRRQVGTHLNPNAVVVSFDLLLHTNYPSGLRLRESVGNRLKSKGYVVVENAGNYDEFTNGTTQVIVYGNKDSNGIGVLLGRNGVLNMAQTEKAALASKIY